MHVMFLQVPKQVSLFVQQVHDKSCDMVETGNEASKLSSQIVKRNIVQWHSPSTTVESPTFVTKMISFLIITGEMVISACNTQVPHFGILPRTCKTKLQSLKQGDFIH